RQLRDEEGAARWRRAWAHPRSPRQELPEPRPRHRPRGSAGRTRRPPLTVRVPDRVQEREDRRPSFWERAPQEPDRLAVIDPDASEWTYGALWRVSNQVANGLVGLGLSREDPVAAVLPNSHHVYEVFTAALQVGLYYVPVNVHLTAAEIEYILSDSGAKAIIAHERFAEASAQAAAAPGIPAEHRIAVGSIDGFRDYHAFAAAQPADSPRHRSPGQRMYYTSGTTGRPKGVRKAFPTGDVDD